MHRLLSILTLIAAIVLPLGTVSAQTLPFCAPGQSPQFTFGFAALKAQLDARMGEPQECVHVEAATGDTLQQTTTGLAFYRKATNTPTFTNGSEHWALTSDGLVYWTGSSIDPPAGAAPPGWVVYLQPEAGFALALPESWTVADTSEMLDEFVTDATDGDGNLALFAIDTSPGALDAEMPGILNVLTGTLPVSLSLDLIVRLNVAQMEQSPALQGPIEQQRLTLPAGSAAQLRYTLSPASGTGRPDLAVTQVLLVRDGQLYLLTFASGTGEAEAYARTFSRIAETLRFLP